MNHGVGATAIDIRRRWPLGFSAMAFVLFAVLFLMFIPASAQDGPDDVAPPPLKVFSKKERDRLRAELDLKDRTKLALEMMDTRLANSERFNDNGDPARMYTELGGFHALMDHVIEHLDRLDPSRGRVLDSYKRFEIGLRKYTPRLEILRREVPLRYEPYIEKLLNYVRDARARALDPMFAETVIEDNDPKPRQDRP
ncbi:MAG: hypothetical protein IPM59_07825 [Chloracidobacterium sp.]|nr:hypothetical protein [Chloracidobacterium sp.]